MDGLPSHLQLCAANTTWLTESNQAVYLNQDVHAKMNPSHSPFLFLCV